MSLNHRVQSVLREITVSAVAPFAPTWSVRLERYLRGREEYRMLGKADFAVVSFPKSGRTWLRVLISHYYHLRYGLPPNVVLQFDNLHRLNPAIPRVFFTHDNYIADLNGSSKTTYARTPTILLVRHPADTAVSTFFHMKHRMKPRKQVINSYVPMTADLSMFDFVLDQSSGLPRVIRFMNGWAAELSSMENLVVVRYETLQHSTVETLDRILRFLGEQATPEELAECAAFASVENMRALEREAFFAGKRRLRPRDPGNPDSYKVRRGKVGGYRDYFDAEQVQKIDALVAESLSPEYGYCGTEPNPRVL